jgi:hypothetical protein
VTTNPPTEGANHVAKTAESRQPFDGLMPRVAAGQRDYPQHLRMLDQLDIEVIVRRNGQLEHDLAAIVHARQAFRDAALQQLLGLHLLGAGDVDLGFKDGHQSGVKDLPGVPELLINDRLTPRSPIGHRRLDAGTHRSGL